MATTLPLQNKTEINPLLVCTLCKGELKTPRLLPCQHSFCTQCLKEKIAILQEGEQLECPFCEKVVHLKNTNVESLPENFLFHIMKESIGLGKGDLVCFSCKTLSKKTSSTHICLDCSDPLCTTCKEWHCRTSVSTHHLVVSFKEMTVQKFKEEWIRRKQIKCAKHEKKMEFYCEECEHLVCNDCFVLEHKHHTCKNWNEVSEKHRPTMHRNVMEFSETHYIYKQRVSRAKKVLERLKKDVKEHENFIYKQAIDLHDLVDKIKAEKLKELENHYEKEMKGINEIIQKESKLESEIDATETFANNFLDQSSDVDFLQHEKEVERMLQMYKQIERKSYGVKFLTTKSEGIDALSDGMQRVFGEISVCCETILQDRRLGEVTEIFKYQAEDSPHFITGLAVDSDGDVLVACHLMPKILVLTSEGKHKGWVECEQLKSPWDIFVKGFDIFVTETAENERKVIVMDKKGKVKKIIKLPEEEQQFNNALCLAVNNESTVIVSSFESGTIYISDPTNDSFIHYITEQDQADMKYPSYLHITARNNLVYRKFGQKIVEAYKGNKELSWTFHGQDGEELSCTTGICGDEAGNIYIADFDNPRIHIVNNGRPVGCIELTEDAKWIRPLAITENDELIYAYLNNIVKIALWE